MLTVNHISKSFGGIKALNDVSFHIEAGELVALIGPNGAGKTTIFNIITGFLKSDSGEIYFRGTKITGEPPEKISSKAVGITRTFQEIKLFFQLSVLENLLAARRFKYGEKFLETILKKKRIREEEKAYKDEAEDLLTFIGLYNKKNNLAAELSYGQQKLLSFAMGIFSESARVVLLDEPISGVNPVIQEQIKSLLFKSCNEFGKTILFIEHNLSFVLEVAGRVIVLNDGKKIATDIPERIFDNEEVQRCYLKL
jgi:ABC-type branched-subunit amino acid transport system ATPase component